MNQNQPTKTVTDRVVAVLRQFAEQQKPAVQTAAKHMDHAAAKVLASVNEFAAPVAEVALTGHPKRPRGLMAGAGHIPLAASAHPQSAAPISDTVTASTAGFNARHRSRAFLRPLPGGFR